MNIDNKKGKIKYKFNNPESKILFEEFSYLLNEITEYMDSSEINNSGPTQRTFIENIRIREMLFEIVKRLFSTFFRILCYLPKRLLVLFKKR